MKTRIKKSFRVISLLTATVFVQLNANAQIKVVGDDYAKSLTASKEYYEKDVDFEKFFPRLSSDLAISRTKDFGHDSKSYRGVNMTGDTVYLYEDLKLVDFDYSWDPGESFFINKKGEAVSETITMPKGYYVFLGYVFCSENEDSVLASYGLEFGREKYYYKSRWDDNSLERLKEEIMKGEEVGVYNYLRYIIFQPIDTASRNENDPILFYLSSYDTRSGFHAMPLSFYNFAYSFLGEKVAVIVDGCLRGNWGPMVADHTKAKVYRDPLINRLVKIEDEYFEVKDVVMRNGNLYIVLEGEKTGSFSYMLGCEEYVKDRDDLNGYTYYRSLGGDIPCLLSELQIENSNERYNLYIIKKDDKAILDSRAKISEEQLKAEWKRQEQRELQEKARRETAFKEQMISKYGTQYGVLVGKKQVAIGMDKNMCRDAWGRPMNTYSTTTSYGKSEVWCYNYKTRVYFYNGKVVQIDD